MCSGKYLHRRPRKARQSPLTTRERERDLRRVLRRGDSLTRGCGLRALQSDLIEKGRGHLLHFLCHLRGTRTQLHQLNRSLSLLGHSRTNTHLSENGKDRCSDIRCTVHVEDDQENALQLQCVRKDLLRRVLQEEFQELQNLQFGLLQLNERRLIRSSLVQRRRVTSALELARRR